MKGIIVCVITAFFINIVLIFATFLESSGTSQFLRLAFILNCTGLVLSISWLLMKKKSKRSDIHEK
ncbi:hypothetical protein AVL55_11120 [Alteromonas macleodii]|uniref:Uncharacterized protein n=1 Tax=Alteromonas macleodii TaxID=28108 RepID=A0A126Q2J1_ALTMA|nr:hypothetical protein AVL55_11120 [Alteromonas macleodii]